VADEATSLHANTTIKTDRKSFEDINPRAVLIPGVEDSADPKGNQAKQHTYQSNNINIQNRNTQKQQQHNNNNQRTCTSTDQPIHKQYQCDGVKQQLEHWREQVPLKTIRQLEQQTRHTTQYTAAIVGSGGLLDYMAAVRSGLKVTWCSEIDETMISLQQHLFTAQNYGDATKINYDTVTVPDIFKSGMPCPDYVENLGSGLGSQGKTGYLYIKQADWLLKLAKRGLKAAILEQTASALHTNEGRDVQNLVQKLSKAFYVHYTVIRMWTHGDVSNRKRLIMVLFNKQLGKMGSKYKFPIGKYNHRYYPTAADVAIPDDAVPEEYILKQDPVHLYKWTKPQPGQIHKVGDFGEGAGHCDLPCPYHSWCGLPGTQLTSNGGSRRTMLNWYPGVTHEYQRLTVPEETAAMASLPSDYITAVKQFYNRISANGSKPVQSQGKEVTCDQFLRQCINNGVPLQTSTALDQSIIIHLDRIAQAANANLTTEAHTAAIFNINNLDESLIRSQMVDIGASGSLIQPDVSHHLQHRRPSQFQIQVAEKNTTMAGLEDGELTIQVLNTAMQPGFSAVTPFTFHTTTVNELRTELLSMDEHYRKGRFN
jgi:hypothetical protein